MGRSSSRSPGHKDRVSNHHHPHKYSGGWKVLHHLPRHQEGGWKGLSHTSRCHTPRKNIGQGRTTDFTVNTILHCAPKRLILALNRTKYITGIRPPLRLAPVQLLPGGWKLTHQFHTPQVPTKFRDGRQISLLTSFHAVTKANQGT